MLDWYLEHGMKLDKIHKKLVYKKSNWLKCYIEFNIEKRKIAKANNNEFANTFFKLMNNAFYGKTLENVRNRQNIEIVYNNERFLQLSRKPTYKRTTIFSDDSRSDNSVDLRSDNSVNLRSDNSVDVAAVHLKRTNVKHDKFNYIGFTILELAKLFMLSLIHI